MKLYIIGDARHGKTHTCERISNKTSLKFKDSSRFAAEKVIFPSLKEKYGYNNFEECFEDRMNHRQEWFELISEINKDDPTTLSQMIWDDGNQIYCGIRSQREILECLKKWEDALVIWISRDSLPLEPFASFDIDRNIAHLLVENNGDLAAFNEKIDKLCELLKWYQHGKKVTK